jgi:FtsP/CotA-like multicopper oxidase with cupredoxin domain
LTGQREHGRKIYDLTPQTGRTAFAAGKPTETWGINGAYLGPTLRAKRGDRVAMRVRNALPQPTTLHWHGMHLPAAADGGPHQPIARGATWSPEWTVEQGAATLWYHPHPEGATADQVYRGLAGMFIVDDPAVDRLALPHRYGIDDIPLIVQDKRLHDDGSLDLGSGPISPTGRLGDTILVNGTPGAYLAVHDERVRLRILNASDARIYNVAFADGRPFQLIATDGGLLVQPKTLRHIQLSPGERAEVVASFRPGERVVLRSLEPELGANFLDRRFAGGDDSFDMLDLRAGRSLRASPPVPRQLTPEPRVARATATRRFRLGGTSINGRDMDMERIDALVARAATEIWEVTNGSGRPHNFHVHGVTFRVLGAAQPALTGPKDTVYVPPGDTVRLLVRLPGYADEHAPYMFHCHVLRHEDSGMMGQFLATDP